MQVRILPSAPGANLDTLKGLEVRGEGKHRLMGSIAKFSFAVQSELGGTRLRQWMPVKVKSGWRLY